MPVKTLNSLLRVVLDQGYSLDWVLQQIDLDFNPLDDNNRHITVIPTASYSKLYQLLMELMRDEAFGLSGQYSAPPGTFRMMCLFVIHARNLGDAVRRAAEFFDYCDQYRPEQPAQRRQPIVPQAADTGEALVQFSFTGAPEDDSSASLISNANILLMMRRFYSWLIGTDLPVNRVHFREPVPHSDSAYTSLFGCEVLFSQANTGLVIDQSLLQHPLAQTEDTLRDYLRQTPYQLVKPSQPDESRTLSIRIESLLARHPTQKPPTADLVAAELNMSPRTLHRKLTAENTSFQMIKDQYRRQLATHYVGRPELTIDTIATLMGFQDNSAFYRSFKKWTGVSPGEYRRRLHSEEEPLKRA